MGERWSTDDTWSLVDEIRKKANFKVLFGPETGENTSGDSKITVHKRIAQSLFPQLFEANQGKAADRIKNRINFLQKTFKENAARLKKTGEGVQAYYQITPDGPDHDTEERAVNIWEEIKREFCYFPELWKMWSTKPNLVPICATTGVGPNGPQGSNGPQTVLIQPAAAQSVPPPSSQQPRAVLGSSTHANGASAGGELRRTVSDSQIDPELLRLSQTSTTTTPSTPITASTGKENLPVSSGRRTARPSSFAAVSGSLDKLPVILPQKRGFEEELVGMSKNMMQRTNRRAEELHQAKKRKYDRLERQQILEERKLLLDEYKADAFGLDEYQEQLRNLNTRLSKLDDQKPVRAPSPDWDEDLLENDQEGREV